MLFRDEDEDLEVPPFANRAEAGSILASRLLAYQGRDDVIVLGLPRGGVPVGSAIAGALHLPLDVLVVSKISSPWSKELAMGALAEGGVQVLDLSIVKHLCIPEENIKTATRIARMELENRRKSYRRGRPARELQRKTVVLVDDGIATGCSVLAAITAVRSKRPARVVVAIPVAPASGCSAIRMEADEVVSVQEPSMFLAVSQWYQDFSQVSDQEVQQLLEENVSSMPCAA